MAVPTVEEVVERQTPIPNAGYEPGQVSCSSRQALCLLLGSRTLHGLHCRYLVRARLNTLLADHIAKELSRGYSKNTLIRVEPKLILQQVIKALLEIGLMIRRLPALDEHVIYVDLHVSANLSREHLVYHPLVRVPGGLQAEGHDLSVIDDILSYKRGLLHIFLRHEYLMVSLESIQKINYLVPGA
ncbi:hypothetical protein LIER_14146 [Lithospermum erythrorhizon]|uniref:Uncharacterized protein n=1 Tax=Lithospermum erythrorhizon TaxID=34254 RepID=A0AAV3Q0J7_LITER